MFPWNETGTRVQSDVPPEREPERGYVRMFRQNEKPDRGHVRQNHPFAGSAKTDLVRFEWGFGEGLLKDKFALFEA